MKTRTITATAALLAALFAGAAGAQYRWVDAEGKVHYGDAPPRDAKDVRALNVRTAPGQPGGDGAASLPFELRRAVERAPVVLYTAPDCQPCALAVGLLRERGVPFTQRTVASPDDLQEFRRISGGLRMPHVTVGNQVQSGFNPDVWMSLLDAAGYPKGSMLPRNYQWPAPQPLVPPAAGAKPQPAGTEQTAAADAAASGAAAPAPASPVPAAPAGR
jgi:glutaredoxin